MIDLHFFDDRPTLVVYRTEIIEFIEKKEEAEKSCGSGFSGCVLIYPNFNGDRCYVIIPADQSKQDAWRKAVKLDCDK